MGRIIVEQHVTADGFVAGPKGELDWVDASVSEQGPMADLALGELAETDAILLGANTYKMFIGYWPHTTDEQDPLAEPINRLPKHVVSSTLAEAPWGDHSPATIESGDPADIADRVKTYYERDLILWGSLQLASALLEAGRVDQLRLRIAPVALGRGTPLWSATPWPRPLKLVATTPLETGQVQLTYDLA